MLLAVPFIMMGILSLVGSFNRASQKQIELSNSHELCAIGWFILAAIVLK